MKQIAALEVDIGVSKLHVGAVSLADGTSIAESETPYQWDVLADGRGEINPDKIWNVAQDALEGVLHQLDMDRVEIKALLVDQNTKVLNFCGHNVGRTPDPGKIMDC